MAIQIPALLESHLALPPQTSQIVLTGVLGASTNWLVLRYLYSLLQIQSGSVSGSGLSGNTTLGTSDNNQSAKHDVSVVFVSFLRDYGFWKDGAGRLGLNLDNLTAQNKFSFVDGLTRLFSRSTGGSAPGSAFARPAVVSSDAAAAAAPKRGGLIFLESPRIADVARTINAAIQKQQQQQRRVVLVLDQPDMLLAAAGAGDGVTSGSLRDLVLDLREEVHATIITLAADEPLVASQTTTLEKEHAAFLLSIAHEAEAMLSLRLLDTGTAKDVSGVVRATRGGASLNQTIEEHEYLYYVGGDGGVKVFERGQ
ncbi:hypothetical protein BD289DRAFT_219691 [Coniella lustricola]|uniref:Elongator complex protein 6 n=1 Tax=Coniella lustricola TaxID=2025994 RepID=A0A2T3ALK9_9PEZI|nr:hypothetical protein BD289DRAFT_219691 [Coniella lustricola]